ncbi:MAG: PAS domain S-box protein, partial [Desulfomonilaceae bacterium]
MTSQWKENWKTLSEREKWYRSLVENSFDGLIVQKGGKVIFANSRLYEMLGYEYGELEGMDHWLIYDKDYQTITRQRAKARERGEDVIPQYEVKLKRKGGSSFWAEISAKSVTVEGEPGSEAWIRDISQRNRAQAVQ